MATKSRVVGRHAESNEQIAAMDWLRMQHPKLVPYTFHIGNERKTSPQVGYIMKRMGVLKGVSDLFMAWPCGGYHGLFIEIKSHTGKPTKDQIEFLERMKEVRYKTYICYGAEHVINAIKEYISL